MFFVISANLFNKKYYMRLLLITCMLTIFAILVRGTLPRYRVDQALTLHWKLVALFFFLFFLEVVVLFNLFCM